MGARFIQPYYAVLYADELTAIGVDTAHIEIPAGHIGRAVEIVNTGTTKLYIAAGAEPAAGMQAVLPVNVVYSGEFDEFTKLYYKSSAPGGAMSVIIRGR